MCDIHLSQLPWASAHGRTYYRYIHSIVWGHGKECYYDKTEDNAYSWKDPGPLFTKKTLFY